MINIGIYSTNKEQKKILNEVFSEYFNRMEIEFKISFIRSKTLLLERMIERYSNYNITIFCDGDMIIYSRRSKVNLARDYCYHTVGWMRMPLTDEMMDKIVLEVDPAICPVGTYKLVTKKVIRSIPYDQIEFCQWDNDKSIIYLVDGETEETSQSIRSIKKSLPEDFFVDCIRGYIINMYNIKRISIAKHSFTMRSGQIIHVNKNRCKSTIRLFFRFVLGL